LVGYRASYVNAVYLSTLEYWNIISNEQNDSGKHIFSVQRMEYDMSHSVISLNTFDAFYDYIDPHYFTYSTSHFCSNGFTVGEAGGCTPTFALLMYVTRGYMLMSTVSEFFVNYKPRPTPTPKATPTPSNHATANQMQRSRNRQRRHVSLHHIVKHYPHHFLPLAAHR
jgi:hypothetical protein